MADKKFYTPLDIHKAIGTKGEYTHVTVIGPIAQLSEITETQTGKKKITFNMPISGRDQTIKKVLELCPEPKDDTVWARVTLWEKTAERFSNLTSKVGSGFKVCVVGAIKCTQNGQYTNLEISGSDFFVTNWATEQNGNSTGNNTGAKPAEKASKPASKPNSKPAAKAAPKKEEAPADDGWSETFDDEDIPF